MKYLILGQPLEMYAQIISAGLWAITRPIRQTNDTQYYCGWVWNDSHTLIALCLPDSDSQPIHIDAGDNIEALCNFIADTITPQEKIDLKDALMEARGGRIDVPNMFPPTLSNLYKTREEMQAFGFFTDLEEEQV